MRFFLRLFLALISTCLSACNTTYLLKEQELRALDSKLLLMSGVKSEFTAAPDPEKSRHLSIFVSQSSINQILAAADGLSWPIPQTQNVYLPNTTLHIDTVRANFYDGYPQVDVAAWAEKPDWKLRLNVKMTAMLEARYSSSDPTSLDLRVRLLEAVPELHWSWFNFLPWFLTYDLLQLKAEEYVNALPAFKVPLQSSFKFDLPAVSKEVAIPGNPGVLYGNVEIPGFTMDGKASIDRVFFLRDGIHVLASVSTTSR